jgi:hypothetical protein
LFVLALVCSVLAGFGMAESAVRSWTHIGAFAAVTVISVYVIPMGNPSLHEAASCAA